MDPGERAGAVAHIVISRGVTPALERSEGLP
jgi:hypothetical protein